MVTVATRAMRYEHQTDPAKILREKLGDLSRVKLMTTNVLVAIYEPPEKTKGGIILTDRKKDEDVHQGKSGLIVAMGPRAFQEKDGEDYFGGVKGKVGDWIWMLPASGRIALVNDVHCRIFKDTDIFAIIPHPDFVY